VLIEIRQAIGKVDIAESMLAQMMDAFASIVSNKPGGTGRRLRGDHRHRRGSARASAVAVGA
jgi:hypothetical protein